MSWKERIKEFRANLGLCDRLLLLLITASFVLRLFLINQDISVIFLTSHLGIRLEKVERIVILGEVPKMPNERENYEGIVKRGLKEEWCGYIRREYEFSMAVAAP